MSFVLNPKLKPTFLVYVSNLQGATFGAIFNGLIPFSKIFIKNKKNSRIFSRRSDFQVFPEEVGTLHMIGGRKQITIKFATIRLMIH